MHFFVIFYVKTFGRFKKKHYLCTRFKERSLSDTMQSSVIPSVRQACNAAIAQLVEHNLAKVGVAGSSPVCRSKS